MKIVVQFLSLIFLLPDFRKDRIGKMVKCQVTGTNLPLHTLADAAIPINNKYHTLCNAKHFITEQIRYAVAKACEEGLTAIEQLLNLLQTVYLENV